MPIFGVIPFIKLQNDKQQLDGEKRDIRGSPTRDIRRESLRDIRAESYT